MLVLRSDLREQGCEVIPEAPNAPDNQPASLNREFDFRVLFKPVIDSRSVRD